MSGVSFVIRTLNEGKTIEEVLKRIFSCNWDGEIEVVIVDSGSEDETLDIASRFGCKIVKIRREDWSWGRSLNLGISFTTFPWVFILSGHCFISSKDFVSKAVFLLTNDDMLAAVYGRQIPIDFVDPFEELELLTWFPSCEKDIRMGPYSFRWTGISNACCLLRKDSWLKVKFREDVSSMDDGYWAYAVRQKGYALLYSSKFGVYHSHRFNPSTVYRRWYWRMYEFFRFMDTVCVHKKYRLIWNIFRYCPLSYKMYRITYKHIEYLQYVAYLLRKYDFLEVEDIKNFLRLKYTAIFNAFRIYLENRSNGATYWDPLCFDEEKWNSIFKRISLFLTKNYEHLPPQL